jgi:hypothetical protein
MPSPMWPEPELPIRFSTYADVTRDAATASQKFTSCPGPSLHARPSQNQIPQAVQTLITGHVRSRDQQKGPVICAQIRYSALTSHGIPAISNERVIDLIS